MYNITAVVLQPFTDTFPVGIARAAGVLMAQGWLMNGIGTYAPSFADSKLQELCLDLVFMNDNFDQVEAALQTEAAEEDHPDFGGVIGPSGSSLCRSVSEVANRMDPVRPVLGISCTATSLSNKELYPNFYRMALPDDVVSEAILGFAIYLGASSIGCIFANAEYPRSIADAIDQKALEGNIVANRYAYEVGDTTFDTVVSLTTREGAPRFLAAVGSGAEDTFLLLKRLWTENMHLTRVFASADIMASGQPAKIDLATQSNPTGAAIFHEMGVVAFKAEGSGERLEKFAQDWPTLVSALDLALLESVSGFAIRSSDITSLPSYVVESVHAVLYMAHAAHTWLSGGALSLGSALKLQTGSELESIYGTLELDRKHDPVPHGYLVPVYRYKGAVEPVTIGTFLLDNGQFEMDASEIEDLRSRVDDGLGTGTNTTTSTTAAQASAAGAGGGSEDGGGSVVGIVVGVVCFVLIVIACCVGWLAYRHFHQTSDADGGDIEAKAEDSRPPQEAPQHGVEEQPAMTQVREEALPQPPADQGPVAPERAEESKEAPVGEVRLPAKVQQLITLVRATDRPVADKLAAVDRLFESKQLKAVAASRQHATAVREFFVGQDRVFSSDELPLEKLDDWHQKLQRDLLKSCGKEERDNLTLLECAVLSQEVMERRVKDFWRILDDVPERPRVTVEVVKFIGRNWDKLREEDSLSQTSEDTTASWHRRAVLLYLLGQPAAVIMETFIGTFGRPVSNELESKYPFLGLARVLCRKDPKVLEVVAEVIYTPPSGTERHMQAALRELLPGAEERTSGLTDAERAAVFMILSTGCSPDPQRQPALPEEAVLGCLIAWGMRGSVQQEGAADQGRKLLRENAPQMVLERMRACTDSTVRTRTMKALQKLNLKEPSSVNHFSTGLLQEVVDQDWPARTSPSIDREALVSFVQSLPLAFRNPNLPEAIVKKLKNFVVKFVEETRGLETPGERKTLVENICYDDSLVQVNTLLSWYIEKFLCGRLLYLQPRQDNDTDPWDCGEGLDEFILPAILGDPETRREGALSKNCPGALRVTDAHRTAMVTALGAANLSPRWLAIFALRLGWLIPVQSGTNTGTKPQLTWGEQETRQFLGRVFGSTVVAKVAALPAVWFNNYSWKDIQDQLFKLAVQLGGAAIAAHVPGHIAMLVGGALTVAATGAPTGDALGRAMIATAQQNDGH